MLNLLPESLSEDVVAQICSDSVESKASTMLSHTEGGVSVTAISNEHVVKFGYSVTMDEFRNQASAFELLKEVENIRVPQPFSFFQKGNIGYLVMEYIHGKEKQRFEQTLTDKVMELLHIFTGFTSDKPGSLCGSPCRGLLWSEYHDFVPTGIEDIEQHFRERLDEGSKLALRDFPLVLVHGDLSARNIIICDDKVCILDWASAGYFPRLFELAAMRVNQPETLLLNVIEKMMQETIWLSDDEKTQALCIEKAANSNMRYVV